MSDPRLFARLLAPLARRIRLMASRAVVGLIDDGAGLQLAQVKLLDGEVRDRVARFQQYGVTSVPFPGAEGVYLSLNGSRDQGVLIAIDDRRYRLKALQPGEAALYDDLGQMIHLTRNGIVIDGAGLPVTITNTPKVRAETDMLECTGEIRDHCDSGSRSMSEMRQVFDGHDHNDPQGGKVGTPNQVMGA